MMAIGLLSSDLYTILQNSHFGDRSWPIGSTHRTWSHPRPVIGRIPTPGRDIKQKYL